MIYKRLTKEGYKMQEDKTFTDLRKYACRGRISSCNFAVNYNRLSAYEDTGLSPAEVEELKHRADVAEEALKILCKNCVECPYVIEDNNKYCKAGYGDGTEECDTSKAYLCWAEYFTQQAEQRLKEIKCIKN